MTYAIGFTGTQVGLTGHQLEAVALVIDELVADAHDEHDAVELHHGMCVGADTEVGNAVHDNYMVRCVGHPGPDPSRTGDVACDSVLPRKDFLLRNRTIVACSDVLVACPDSPERLRSGTWATVRYARKTGVPVIIVWPDGTVER